jgi:glycosyltransferase involved in cell wall biosynthesis
VIFGSLAASLINFRGPLIAALVARGHEVFALAPDICPETQRALREIGAEPVSVSLGRTSLSPLGAVQTVRDLVRRFRQLKPDVVLAYTIKPIGLAAIAARAAGIPRFIPMVTGLGYAFTAGREPKRLISRALGRLLYRRAFRNADVAIFQNPDDLAEFRRIGVLPKRLPTTIVAGSGIDVQRFQQVPLPPGASFLMIARLLKDKGVREYGEAARQLKERHPEVRVSLVGHLDPSPDSISQAELDELIRGGVVFMGSMADVRPAIAAHSIYVLPSYREGTPRSVLEAMAMGRPVITTDAPGCRETVENGVNGWLITPRDASALFRAMHTMVVQAGELQRMGEASREFAERKFDVNKVNGNILAYCGL